MVGGVGVGLRDENGRLVLCLRFGTGMLRWEALEEMLTWLGLLGRSGGWSRGERGGFECHDVEIMYSYSTP